MTRSPIKRPPLGPSPQTSLHEPGSRYLCVAREVVHMPAASGLESCGLSGSSCRAFASSSHKWPKSARSASAVRLYGRGRVHVRTPDLSGGPRHDLAMALAACAPRRFGNCRAHGTTLHERPPAPRSAARGRRGGPAPHPALAHHHGACVYIGCIATCHVHVRCFAYPYLCLIYAPAPYGTWLVGRGTEL